MDITESCSLYVIVKWKSGSDQKLTVAGNVNELGLWNVQHGMKLEWDDVDKVWRGNKIVRRGTSIELNYYVNDRPISGVINREISNRTILAEGVAVYIQENFDKEQDMRIYKDMGYLHNYELRLYFASNSTRFNKPNSDEIRYRFKPLTYKQNKIKDINPSRKLKNEMTWIVPRFEDMGLFIILESPEKKILGRVALVASEFKNNIGSIVRPIIDAQFNVIGEISFQFLVITPFVHDKNIFYENILAPNWGSHLDMIGHRGFGTNAQSYIRENTILSFNTAHMNGIKYVEFDVHLTAENIPVIYHDFFIPLNNINIPIANLNLNQFREALSICSSFATHILPSISDKVRRSKSHADFKITDNNGVKARYLISDAQFPTLQELFENVDENVGFNIEIKYPHDAVSARANCLERNIFANHILEVVFSHAGNRPIYFSTFDPDLCVIVSRKQRKYPVFFLTEGKSHSERPYDPRCTSVLSAAEFAQKAGLQGIVTDAKPIIANINFVNEIHKKNLLLFTYGSPNNVPESVSIQKQNGVDGIISDKVTKIRNYSKSIQK